MAHVFLSYAAEDRPRVEPLVRAIEASGLTVWWDRRIGMGSSFDVVIERELDAASCVVVVWSVHSIASEWVRSEANEGAERGILVPVQIDDVRPLSHSDARRAPCFQAGPRAPTAKRLPNWFAASVRSQRVSHPNRSSHNTSKQNANRSSWPCCHSRTGVPNATWRTFAKGLRKTS